MDEATVAVIGDWMRGELTDEMLASLISDRDLRTLQKRVMTAITAKLMESPESIVFAEHRTVQ